MLFGEVVQTRVVLEGTFGRRVEIPSSNGLHLFLDFLELILTIVVPVFIGPHA